MSIGRRGGRSQLPERAALAQDESAESSIQRRVEGIRTRGCSFCRTGRSNGWRSLQSSVAARPGRAQVQQGAAWKSDDFLDIPAIAADCDDVAGGERWMRHAGVRGKPRARRCVRGPNSGVSRATVAPRCESGVVAELDDERVPFERLLHDAALDAVAASMNQADLAQAGGVRGADVFVDDRSDVARRGRRGDRVSRSVCDRDRSSAHRRTFGLDPAADREVADHGHPARAGTTRQDRRGSDW